MVHLDATATLLNNLEECGGDAAEHRTSPEPLEPGSSRE